MIDQGRHRTDDLRRVLVTKDADDGPGVPAGRPQGPLPDVRRKDLRSRLVVRNIQYPFTGSRRACYGYDLKAARKTHPAKRAAHSALIESEPGSEPPPVESLNGRES